MEIKKQELDRIMEAPFGSNAYLDGKPLTIKMSLAIAANQLVQGRSPKEAVEAANLFDRINEANGSLHLEAEEVVFLKKMAAASTAPSIYKQLHKVLESETEDP